MGKIPDELRRNIANNIRACRLKKFPGRGGGKKCAEAFGVSPQQWSPWERGMRTPDEVRLQSIAKFFGVTVEYLRKDHSAPPEAKEELPAPLSAHTFTDAPLHADQEEPPLRAVGYPCCPFYSPPRPGQPFSGEVRSLCWLAERLFGDLRTFGLPIRLRAEDVDLILERYFQRKGPQD